MGKNTISEVVKMYAQVGDIIEVKNSEFPRHGFDSEFLLSDGTVQTISTYRKKKDVFLKEAIKNGAKTVAYGVMFNDTAILDKESIVVEPTDWNDANNPMDLIVMTLNERYIVPSYRSMHLGNLNDGKKPFMVYLYEQDNHGNEKGGKLICIGRKSFR